MVIFDVKVAIAAGKLKYYIIRLLKAGRGMGGRVYVVFKTGSSTQKCVISEVKEVLIDY